MSIGSFQGLPAEALEVILLSQRLALKYNTTPPDDCQHFLTSFFQIFCGGDKRPLRRSRARFPLLSPAVTSSPGAGEVFPQRGSQGLRPVAEVLGVMRKFPAVLLALPLGELSPQVTERACKANGCCPSSGAARHLPPVGEGFSGSDTVSGTAKAVPLWELARERLRGFSLYYYII